MFPTQESRSHSYRGYLSTSLDHESPSEKRIFARTFQQKRSLSLAFLFDVEREMGKRAARVLGETARGFSKRRPTRTVQRAVSMCAFSVFAKTRVSLVSPSFLIGSRTGLAECIRRPLSLSLSLSKFNRNLHGP